MRGLTVSSLPCADTDEYDANHAKGGWYRVFGQDGDKNSRQDHE